MATTMGNGGNNMNNNITRDIARVLAGTGLLLLIPFVGMQFSSGFNWGLFDFVAAGALLATSGIGYVLLAARVKTARQRMLVGAVLGLLLLTIWAELAVGLFD